MTDCINCTCISECSITELTYVVEKNYSILTALVKYKYITTVVSTLLINKAYDECSNVLVLNKINLITLFVYMYILIKTNVMMEFR